jgi:hypothetical protein
MNVMAILRQLRLTERLENQGEVWQRLLVLLERDDDFRWGVPVFYVSNGTGGFSQRVASVDHRGYLSGLDKSAERHQVVSIHFCYEECEFLPQEQ